MTSFNISDCSYSNYDSSGIVIDYVYKYIPNNADGFNVYPSLQV